MLVGESVSDSNSLCVVILIAGVSSSSDPVFSRIRLRGGTGVSSTLIDGTRGTCFLRTGGEAKVTFNVGITIGGGSWEDEDEESGSSADDTVISGVVIRDPTSTL